MYSLLGLSAQDSGNYPFKSGLIKYAIHGPAEGTEQIYFDDFGQRISYLKVTTHSGSSGLPADSLFIIIQHDSLFEYDLTNHKMLRQEKTSPAVGVRFNIISPEMIDLLGYRLTGHEQIAGKTCDKFTGENGNLWVWNNIVLKSEIEIINTRLVTEATVIQVNTPVPDMYFKKPFNKMINQ
jgi:hypothetical protein